MSLRLSILSLLLALSAGAQIVPASRLATWHGNVGVPGGIPYRTNIAATLGAGASVSAINSAISAAPSNSVVLLSAGSYTVSSQILLKSGVTLRGAGPGSTILNASANQSIFGQGSYLDYTSGSFEVNGAYHASWIGNYNQGTNVILISSTNLAGGAQSLPVGQLLWLDQLNGTNSTQLNGYGSPNSDYTSITDPGQGRDRKEKQLSYVLAVNGNAITIDPPVEMSVFNTSQTPQVWWYGSGPIKFAGVEDLALAFTASAYPGNELRGIEFQYAYGCWVRNCKVTHARYDIATEAGAVRCEWRHNQVEGTSGGHDDYAFSIYWCGAGWFEDNIADNVITPFLLETATGNAFSYNFVTNCNSQLAYGNGWAVQAWVTHGGGCSANLVEGNVLLSGVGMDNGWGCGENQTFLRNYISGDDVPGPVTQYVQCFDDGSMNRVMNYVGNVLGTPGVNTVYQSSSRNGSLPGTIWLMGYSVGGVTPSPDSAVASTAIRAMNYDTATSTNGGLVTGGYSSSDVPNSYLYTTAPTNFGSLTWPPVDPNSVPLSTSLTNIPAGYRFINGVDPPAGGGGSSATVGTLTVTNLLIGP